MNANNRPKSAVTTTGHTECARLLALNLAHYQGLYGEVPLDEVLAALDASAPNDDQAKLVARGMENLVGVLGSVLSGLGEEKH